MGLFQQIRSFFSSENGKQNKTGSPKSNEGVVKSFNHSRGFGFIHSKAFDRKIFLHISEAEGRPKVGQKVVFEVEETEKGLRALNVKLATN